MPWRLPPTCPSRWSRFFLFTCVNCGHIAEGERPETCPICGALSVEFDSFGPFYAADAEHLGRLTPARILAILAATPDEIRALVTDVDDAVLAAKPSASEWSVKEIIGHIVVTDGLFVRRVDAILDQAEYQQPMPPWDLHVGKGYHAKSVHELLDLLESARGRSLNLVQALSPQQWANAWSMLGGSRSVLEIGTWHANHDVGHIAQIRRLLDAA